MTHTLDSLHARIALLESTLALPHPPDVCGATAVHAVDALKSIIFNKYAKDGK